VKSVSALRGTRHSVRFRAIFGREQVALRQGKSTELFR
jgi:hypothetical protein